MEKHGYKIPIDRRTGKPVPFILFKHRPWIKKKSKEEITRDKEDYFYLPVDGAHGDSLKIDYYLNKGFKIIDHYLPEVRQDNAFIGHTNFGDDVNNFKDLRHIISRESNRVSVEQHQATEARAKQFEEENKILQARLEQALAKKGKSDDK